MDNLNIWGVNWIDGMLVTSSHLNQQQDYALNLSRWNASVLSSGYGLAKGATDKNEPLEIQLRRDGNTLIVSVLRCTALLPNGTPLNVNADFLKHKVVETKVDIGSETRDRIPVYLYSSPGEKTPFGDPLSGEQLSRQPFQTPRLTLSVGPSSTLSAASGFQIAELARSGNDFQLDANFVPAVMTSASGKAVSSRMERLRKLIEGIQRNGVAAVAEMRAKQRGKLAAGEDEIIRGVFLQTETLLHYVGYHYNQVFDGLVGVSSRSLITYFTGLVGGFQQGFLIYPELREYVRSAQIGSGENSQSGANVLPELRDYQIREYGFDQMTAFFSDTEKQLTFVSDILGFYAQGKAGPVEDVLKIGEYTYMRQQHGAVKYSFRNGRHHIIIDGVDPRGTEDVVVRLDKRVLPLQYAGNVIIYLGANEVDDIAAASVARKPVEDVSNPDYWLIQPNEFFPLKSNRLDRLNVIIDGDVDRSALEAVKLNHVSIFSRSR